MTRSATASNLRSEVGPRRREVLPPPDFDLRQSDASSLTVRAGSVGPELGARGPLQTLMLDDGSALAHAIASTIDPAAIEIHRSRITDSDHTDLVARCDFADAVVFVTDSWDVGAMTNAHGVLMRVLDTLRGSGKKLVYVSEAIVIGDTGDSFGNEDSPRSTRSPHPWHRTAEIALLRAVSTGVHSVIVRRSLVHGRGAGELLERLIARARWADEATFVGGGAPATSTVHVDDLSRLVQTALLRAPQGAAYTAASEEILTWRGIAELVAHTQQPACKLRSLSVSEADILGLDGKTMAINNVIVDDGPRRRLGWIATGPTLAAELARVAPAA